MSNIDAEEIDVNTLLDGAAKLLRDANRWRKLEMLIEKMIDHEPQWAVFKGSMNDSQEGTYLSVEELIEEIDKVDPISPLGYGISKDQD